MRRTIAALGMLGIAASLIAAIPAHAASSIHFYTYENPSSPSKAVTVDVVQGNPQEGEHQVGTCENKRIGRDFFNE